MTTTTALTWSLVKQFGFTNPPQIVIGRSPEVYIKYVEAGQIIKETGNGGIKTHLMSKYLSNGNDYCMTLNNYPYYMEDGICHYVIWFKGDKFDRYNNMGNIEDIIQKYMEHNNIDVDCEYVYYQNIEALRSIPSIPHLHVFIKFD